MKKQIEKVENLAHWMDSRFKIPFTSVRFGLDSLLGLIPGIGDTVTVASTAYILSVAHEMKVPLSIKIKILWNAFLDWLVGLIPFIGDFFDVAFKSNIKNVALLKEYADNYEA